jgi:hypothetical protein
MQSCRPPTSLMSHVGTELTIFDVRSHGELQKTDGHDTDIASRPSLTQLRHQRAKMIEWPRAQKDAVGIHRGCPGPV